MSVHDALMERLVNKTLEEYFTYYEDSEIAMIFEDGKPSYLVYDGN